METLEEKQAEMKRRHLAAKQQQNLEKAQAFVPVAHPESRTICISCKHRVARIGEVFCSRCTGKGLQNDLRSTLPPSMLPVPKVTTFSTGDQNESGSNNNNTKFVESRSDSSSESNLTSNQESNYTRSQVADILGISPTTLCRWERKGKIPQPKRIAHSNQCIYSQTLFEIAKEYMSKEYIPPPVAVDPANPSTRLQMASKKSVKINKRAESAVASRIGNFGRRIL